MLSTTLWGNKECHEAEIALKELVQQYNDVLAVTEQEFTQMALVEHDINTGNVFPIRQKQAHSNRYQYSPHKDPYQSEGQGCDRE